MGNFETLSPSEQDTILNSVLGLNKDSEKKVFDNRVMPSMYLIDIIKSSSSKTNNSKLLLGIVSSLNNLSWSEIHPEHLRIIIIGLSKYDDGKILNDFLLEILKQTNII